MQIFDRAEAIQRSLDYNGIEVVVWNKLYKAHLFDSIIFPPGRMHEDEFTTYKLIAKSSRHVRTNEIGYMYVQRNGSIMSQISPKRINDLIDAHRERLAWASEQGIKYQSLAAVHGAKVTKYMLKTYRGQLTPAQIKTLQDNHIFFTKNIKLTRLPFSRLFKSLIHLLLGRI